MINTPVSYSNKFSNITDSEGCFVAHVVKENKADEIIKRINMHDELVAKPTECTNELNLVINRHNSFIEEPWGDVIDAQTVYECFELLERCK